jgi:hypothetical protein
MNLGTGWREVRGGCIERMDNMAAKCDMCGKMTKKYFTSYAGDILCSKTCKNAYVLESYLLRMEERRQKDEATNKRAFQQAREMAAWLSIYKYGNEAAKRLAAKAINAWAG